MPAVLPSYIIISPVRDEAAFLPHTAEAVLRQVHPPRRWVIVVDEGSRDETLEVAQSYADAQDWIAVVPSGRSDRRARGGPVVRAFDLGRAVADTAADVTVKLDGDIVVDPHYFETVMQAFAERPRVAIAGGLVHIPTRRGWRRDRIDRHTVHGAIKAYRTDALDEIGGVHASMGWDGIDEMAMRARGWEVCVLPELHVHHLRPRGAAQPWYEARWEEGTGAWAMGYRHDFMALRCIYRMLFERPPALGGIVLAAGYVAAARQRAPRIDDPMAIRLLRSEQRRKLQRMIGVQ